MNKKEAFEAAAELFDKCKDDYKSTLIKNLSSEDETSRRNAARFLTEQVLPTLEFDQGSGSEDASRTTLLRLIEELRPPRGRDEESDFDNAIFHYTLVQLNLSWDEADTNEPSAARPKAGCLALVVPLLVPVLSLWEA